ncbi:response regulator transcription factor [Burkholderia ubonensis]|uniref:response regulator transcription factor n=1 Tax=Burkholderia ubonensis TaxID=101571 RepID=UPI0009B311E6|nr:response regulator transcription factor [Burkholderia ubonensis]
MLSNLEEYSLCADAMNQRCLRPLQSRIAILDADIERAVLVDRALSANDYARHCYVSVTQFMEDQQDHPSDVIVMGDEIRGASCTDALRYIRQTPQTHHTPVLILGDVADSQLIAMHECGADLLERWPINANVLAARVGALLRRRALRLDWAHQAKEVYGAYVFDSRGMKVWIRGRPIKLTPKEFQIALFFFRNERSIVTKEALWGRAWENSAPENMSKRSIEVHISRIRKKLLLTGENGYCLSHVQDAGYRLAGHFELPLI